MGLAAGLKSSPAASFMSLNEKLILNPDAMAMWTGKLLQQLPVLLLAGMVVVPAAQATTYTIGSNSAFTAALGSVNPGDSIVISNGNYSGVAVTRGGTAANPVTIAAANLGQAVIGTGVFTLDNVSYVTIQGLDFTNKGASVAVDGTSDNMVLGLIGATNCRVTRCTFAPPTSTLPANTFFTYLNGTCLSNRIDHCEYGWYTNSGCHAIRTSGTVAIAGVTAPSDRMAWALGYGPYNPNMTRQTWIDHNYLHDHYTPAANGGETIQLGAIGDTGDYQSIYSTVEYNLFVNCDGDPEIISVKSSNNTLRYNTVTNSSAVFSLRAGNSDSVYGNFFLCGGSGGGIKMCERDHKIFNNYIENSDTSSYPLMLESGNLYNVAFSHAEVVRAEIVHNTVVNPGRQVLFAHSGSLPVVDFVFANNLITGSGTLYSEDVTSVNPMRSQNIISGYTPGQSGFLVENPQLTGVSPQRLSASSPAINAANTNYYSYVTDDMDGQPRTLPRDIGADEYYSSASFIARAPLTTNSVGPNSVDIEVSASPAWQTVNIGATNVSYAINITADAGFANPVTLMVNGLPPGMSAGFNPPTVNGSGAVTLNITNTSAVLGGAYPFILTATSGNLQSGATVTLQVGRGASNLRWAATGSGVWNVQNSSNWFNLSSNATDTFYNGDTVLLDDSSGVQTNLTLAAGVVVSPAIVTNNSSTNNFTISGSGAITGATKFVKTGAGTLILNTTNEFGGGMVVAGGILKAGNPYALGGQGGFIILTNGGTLDVNGNNLGMDAVLVAGAGVSNNGAIINSGAAVYPALAVVEMAADATIGGSNRWDLRAVGGTTGDPSTASLSTSGNAYDLTKTGPNFFGLCSVTVDAALANVNVQGGIFDFEGDTTGLGNSASTLTVFTNATFELWSATNQLNKKITLDDGATILNGSGANTVIGPVMLNGNDTFNIGGTSLAFSNTLSGPGRLVKAGSSILYLAGADTCSGSTTISNGSVVLSGSIADSPLITVAAGATLDASARSDNTLTLLGGQTLAGGGMVKGNVSVHAGATLAPGSAINTLVLNSNLTLNAGSQTIMGADKSSSPSNDLVQVAYSVVYGGALLITNLGAVSFAAGDSFKLFSAANYSGAFTNISPVIPGLNLAWNTNNLVTNGVLTVISSPTPPPKFAAMTRSGTNFIFAGTNGVPGWPYIVLTTTNLALPLAGWTSSVTNYFSGTGGFSFTNTPPAGPAGQFYLLMLQ